MQMFSAGIGIGLFFFGVAEPVFHYEPCSAQPQAGPGSACYGNRYAQLHADERAQWAMNLAFFHWGIHGWVAYCIVGLILATVVYRRCGSPSPPPPPTSAPCRLYKPSYKLEQTTNAAAFV